MAEIHSFPNNSRQDSGSTDLEEALIRRLGPVHARQRLGIEQEYEHRVFGHGTNFFHIENWRSGRTLVHSALKLSGLYRRGRRNAGDVQIRHIHISSAKLPKVFDGYTILHISDPHVEMSGDAIQFIESKISELEFDLCVMTGDYRALTYGPYGEVVERMEKLCAGIKTPIFGVLGNHDTIRMVPALEDMGIHMLLNEFVAIKHGDGHFHLAGIDDAHYYRVDNIEKAAGGIDTEEFSILLSHTPEVYRQAAHAGFDLMLSGHTHAGQICLPGQYALKLNAKLPRRYGSGLWMHGQMHGYTSSGVGTSVVTARFNCPPEITLHHLECA